MKKTFHSKRTEKAFQTALANLSKLPEIPLSKIPLEWKEDFMAWLPLNRPYKGNGMQPVSPDVFLSYQKKLQEEGLSYSLKFKLPAKRKKRTAKAKPRKG